MQPGQVDPEHSDRLGPHRHLARRRVELPPLGPLFRRPPHPGEAVAEEILRSQTETKKGYFFNFDKWNLGVRPRLDVEYDSNISRAPDGGEIDDIILRPEVNFDFYRAITDFNSLDFTLGVGMDIYTKNTDVNTYSPIISPDSEIAYHMFIGDAHVKLREAFYYQEDQYK